MLLRSLLPGSQLSPTKRSLSELLCDGASLRITLSDELVVVALSRKSRERALPGIAGRLRELQKQTCDLHLHHLIFVIVWQWTARNSEKCAPPGVIGS